MPLLDGDRLIPHDPESREVRKRFFLPPILVIIAFSALFLRLWYLQIAKGGEYEYTSRMNRIRSVRVPAPRGMILDRGGRIIADNVPSYSAYVTPEDVKDLPATLKKAGEFLSIDNDSIKGVIEGAEGLQVFKPFLLKKELTWEELARLEVHNLMLPGVSVEWEPRRSYIYGTAASHLIGYVGEIDRAKLKALRRKKDVYRMGDFIGKAGVEERMESYLKGSDGAVMKKVDAFGRDVDVVEETQSYPGKNIFLSIDMDIQLTAERLLKDKAGSIIAMDPRTGEILAMANSPSFDPSLFAGGVAPEVWQKLASDPSHPLENKALRGVYPPGSTFKVITAAAALEEKLITPETTFHCPGWFRVGRRVFRCWKRGGHGDVDMRKAIVQSCDVYFYRVGQMLGVSRLAAYARRFGLGSPTGIGMGNEKSGLVPTPEWKLAQTATPWMEGETILNAIGQGYVLLTPLQLLNVYSAVANGGKLMRPLVIKRIEYMDGKPVEDFPPDVLGTVGIHEETLDFIRDALAGVVNEKGGTGGAAQLPDVVVAGKTGTAQVIRSRLYDKLRESEVPEDLRDHAWFVSFAPAHHPEIAVIVMIEHGGHGGATAAPLAGEIIRTYFHSREAGHAL